MGESIAGKNPDIFLKTMARNLWTPRGLTLKCLKNSADLKQAVPGDTRSPMTPEKVDVFIGK